MALLAAVPVATGQESPSPRAGYEIPASQVVGRLRDGPREEEEGSTPGQDSGGEGSSPQAQEPRKTLVNQLHERFRWELWDGAVRLRLGAALQVDGTTGTEDEEFTQTYGDVENSIDVRRARINATGTALGMLFSVQYDFGQDQGLKDAYIEVLGESRDLAAVRLGNFKESFSLERQTSNAYTAFLERSLPVTTFAPGRNFGAQVFNSVLEERATWAFGVFTNSGNPVAADGSGASDLTATGRITALPLYENDGNQLLHLGLSYSLRAPKDDTVQYSSRPEARSTVHVVDTGPFAASSNTLLGLELAGTHKKAWFMAEAMRSDVSAADSGDPTFHGYYLQLGYFLTDDKKPYDTSTGVFGHPLPDDPYSGGTLEALDSLRPFRHRRRHGAWEIVGRLSHVDLDDGAIRGGTATNVSAAVNWYLNANVRFDLNYVHSDIVDRGSANLLLGRMQFTF